MDFEKCYCEIEKVFDFFVSYAIFCKKEELPALSKLSFKNHIDSYIYKNGIKIFQNKRDLYSPASDSIALSTKSRSKVEEDISFYHELGHSTAHDERLKRKFLLCKDKDKELIEEYVVEIFSLYCCMVSGYKRDVYELIKNFYFFNRFPSVNDYRHTIVFNSALILFYILSF